MATKAKAAPKGWEKHSAALAPSGKATAVYPSENLLTVNPVLSYGQVWAAQHGNQAALARNAAPLATFNPPAWTAPTQ